MCKVLQAADLPLFEDRNKNSNFLANKYFEQYWKTSIAVS